MDRSTARSLVYNGLSISYLNPDDKIYSLITAGKWIRRFREALYLLDENTFYDPLRAIEEIISKGKIDEQLAISLEYNRLFLDGLPHPIVPPYGSFYLHKEGHLSNETISHILHFYQEAGFNLKEDLRDLPDHIAHELNFMAFLSGKEGQTTGNEKIKLEEIQMPFLSQFILPGIPSFCEKLTEFCHHPFYYFLSHLTKEFINFEKNYLGIPEE